MESIKDASAIAITEETQVAAARRAVADLCRRLDLSESTTARAELIAVELAGNILNHAKRGTLYMGPTATGLGIQLIASDLGPGLGDVEQAMRDGFSTSTTPGPTRRSWLSAASRGSASSMSDQCMSRLPRPPRNSPSPAR